MSLSNGDLATEKQRPALLDFYPFAYALLDECLATHCWYCLDDEAKHRRCTGCQRALFCDKQCQSLAWKDHKFECRGIKAHSGKVPDIEVRLLGRIVARHKAILCGVDKKDPDFYKDRSSRRNIMDIWAHTKNMEKDEFAVKKFEAIYDRLSHFYDSKALLNKQIVFELHCRDFINRHAISDKHYLREIGKGLYLDLCAYDHSCRPNTVYSCHSFIATLRPLNSGVNLLDRSATFYAYIDLLCAKQDRRKLLKDTWYFHCDCERCQDGEEHLLSAMLCPNCQQSDGEQPGPMRLCIFGQQDYKEEQSQLITCPQCGKLLAKEQVLEAITAMRFISDVLERTNLEEMAKPEAIQFLEDLLDRFSQLLPPVNVYLCKIVQALLPFVDPDDSARLLELHLLVEQCIRLCYPHNHPALAFHLRNIGIFAKCRGQRAMALRYLEEAKEMFQFVMGPGHSLSTITGEILEEVRGMEEEKQKEENGKPVMAQIGWKVKPKEKQTKKKEEREEAEEKPEEKQTKKEEEKESIEEKPTKEKGKKKRKAGKEKHKKEIGMELEGNAENGMKSAEGKQSKKKEDRKRRGKKQCQESEEIKQDNGIEREKETKEAKEEAIDEARLEAPTVPPAVNVPELLIEEGKAEEKAETIPPTFEISFSFPLEDNPNEKLPENAPMESQMPLEVPILCVEAEEEAKEEAEEAPLGKELFLQLSPNASRPGSALSANSANSLSPCQAEGGGGGHSPGGGVKKKLHSKKTSPRARTPMYPKLKNGGENGQQGEGKLENGEKPNEEKPEEEKKPEDKQERPENEEKPGIEEKLETEEKPGGEGKVKIEENPDELDPQMKENGKGQEIKTKLNGQKEEEEKQREEEAGEVKEEAEEDCKMQEMMTEVKPKEEEKPVENGGKDEAEVKPEEKEVKEIVTKQEEKTEDGWQQQKSRKSRSATNKKKKLN